jgi:hypothetical protein
MLAVNVEDNSIRIGERFSVHFLRTLRVPDDGRTYPLPPGLGEFPLHCVKDYADKVPEEWLPKGGFFIPLYQREACWIGFDAEKWKPNAVKVGVGNVNAITGEIWNDTLHDNPQDYLVCPFQPWLDGINSGEGTVRQFVATSLLSDTIESQVAGSETGGLQIQVFEPRPGIFPDSRPPRKLPEAFQTESVSSDGAMGLGAGGAIKQKIYPDPFGLETWDQKNSGHVWIHILNSAQYEEITGLRAPATPIDAHTYTQHGFPWFELYEEHLNDLPASKHLAAVKSIREKEVERGESETVDEPVEISPDQIMPLEADKSKKDG